MSDVKTETVMKLAAPGAGLPWVELQVARLIFAWQFRRSSRESASALLKAEMAEIRRLATSCDKIDGSRRVLIRRIPGMEDSSRYWSVFMTLDHLRIVNGFLAETIALLGRGEIPGRVASTAAVKPDPGADATVLASLEDACGDLARTVSGITDLRATGRHAHPWFGPLDAAAWHFLAGFHMRLHRGQIRAILHGLAEDGKPSAA